jgi:hypothetical protein
MKKISLFVLASTLLINTVSAEPNSTSPETSDITFATLNTTVDGKSNHLINATVTDGKYKGSKLYGKLVTTKGEPGTPDRTSLNFTSMNVDRKSKPLDISAYAIDASTAHTALRSKVSHEYLQQNGITLAASLIQSYGQKENPSLPNHSKNSYPVKINVGTDIGILFISKLPT